MLKIRRMFQKCFFYKNVLKSPKPYQKGIPKPILVFGYILGNGSGQELPFYIYKIQILII